MYSRRTKTIWKMFLNYILVPYIVKNLSDYNCYQLDIHLRQSFKYSGAILLWIVYNIQYFKIEIRVACRRLLYSVIWTDGESYRRTTTLVKSMITVVSLRELHAYILRFNINNFNKFMHSKTEISITWQLHLI
jgi:hypothetical protein